MTRWPVVAMGNIVRFQPGVGFPLSMQGKPVGRYPLAKVGDISRAGRAGARMLSTADHFVNDSDLDSLGAKPIPTGSILFAKIGEAMRHNHRVIAGCDLLVDNNAIAAIPGPRITSAYLFHYLKTVNMYALASTTTVPSVRKSQLEQLMLALPPLDEQRRIAEVLDRADALRARRQAAIARLDILIDSIFLDMFGDAKHNDRSWPTVCLWHLLTMPLRNGVSPSHGASVQATVLTLSAITGVAFDASAQKVATFRHRPAQRQLVDQRDLLICRGNGNLRLVGKGHFPPGSMPGVIFPDTMIAARVAPDRAEPAFLEHVWNSDSVRGQLEGLARTTNGTFKVNQTMLEGVSVIAPPLALQGDFANRRRAIEIIRARHLASFKEMDALFASLQYRAFRGEL